MRVALIAPPFIPVPPKNYGGTELFIAELAVGLKARGIDVVVYANGESSVPVETRWMYQRSQWPLRSEFAENIKDSIHAAWAVRDAAEDCDVIHLNNASGVMFSEFVSRPMVYTIHHPHTPELGTLYRHFSRPQYVCISGHQCSRQGIPDAKVIHHGIDTANYRLHQGKREYLSFIGRIAPVKGTHLAIEVAQATGIPLKIAGEVQPMFREYFDSQIKPKIDGRFIEYIGEADLKQKNELLGNSLAMLFPIQWDEPFGLVLVEAMACGTPVIALGRGSVPEIVRDNVSGYVCGSVDEMTQRVSQMRDGKTLAPALVRDHMEENFSLARMVAAYIALYEQLIEGNARAIRSEVPPESAVA